MNFKHFNKDKAGLKFEGILASIYHQKFEKGTYEYVVLPDTVRVLGVTQDTKLILIKEKIISFNKSFYNLPGGAVEKNEKAIETAKRELEEETGYVSNEIIPWFNHNYSQTIISRKHFFIAKNCVKNGEQKLESTEDISVLEKEVGEFLNLVTSEEFKQLELQNIFYRMRLDEDYKK